MGMNVILPLDKCFRYGEEVAQRLHREMTHGIAVMQVHDIAILTQMICHNEGDHLEIGTAYGASAIVAALAMEFIGRDGKIVCIDPMEGELAHSSLEVFWQNTKALKVDDKIEFFQQKSQPYPLGDRRFGTALIDGDHSTECVTEDWKNVSNVTLSHIMLHDYGQIFSVRKAVRDVVLPDENWAISHACGWSLIMKRIKWT
jgi:tRNA A58 N-methylase Trm61